MIMDDAAMRHCAHCDTVKPLTTEHYYLTVRKGKPYFLHWCKVCRRADYHKRFQEDPKHAQRVAYLRRRVKVAEIQRRRSEIGCADCGETHPAVLDFHHKERVTKHKGIATLVGHNNKLARIEAEIAKCIVLCSNCHRKRHFTERAAKHASRSA